MASGGSKAVKELEKEQKSRSTRMVRDYLDRALLDLATLYRDVLLLQSGVSKNLVNTDFEKEIIEISNTIRMNKTLYNIHAINTYRIYLSNNGSPLLMLEALMCLLIS